MDTVFSLFDDERDAEGAVQHLLDAGIDRANIGIAAVRQGEPQVGAAPAREPVLAYDAEKGAVVGGLAGLMLGLAEVATPPVGALLAGGWILTMLAGAVIGAAGGGLFGALAELGLPHERARQFESGLRRGGTMVTARVEDLSVERVVGILHYHRATDVHTGKPAASEAERTHARAA